MSAQAYESDVTLATNAILFTSKESKVINILEKEGYIVPIPSSSDVYKAGMFIKNILPQMCFTNYEWHLHFNGKFLEGEKQI